MLVLLTSSDVNDDFEEAEEKINEASELPISVVVIGIGQKSFIRIPKLGNGGRTAKEDRRLNYTYIHFKDYKHDYHGLCSAIMKKIPDQLVEFFRDKNIHPNVYD